MKLDSKKIVNKRKACTQAREHRLDSKKIIKKLKEDKEFKKMATHAVLILDKDTLQRRKELFNKFFPNRVQVFYDYYFPLIKAIICGENGAKIQIENKETEKAYYRLEKSLEINNITHIGQIHNKVKLAQELKVSKPMLNIFLAYYFSKCGDPYYLNQNRRVKIPNNRDKGKPNQFKLIEA